MQRRNFSFYLLVIAMILTPLCVKAQWDKYFDDASLRIDYLHSGRFQLDYFTVDTYTKLPFYSGSHKNLVDRTNNGAYRVELQEKKTKKLIFSKNFSTLFNEWQSSEEAKRMCGNFEETVIVPFPKPEFDIDIVFFSRDSVNAWQEVSRIELDRSIIQDSHPNKLNIIPLHQSLRTMDKRLDLVFIPVGYTKGEKNKMLKDLKKFADFMFIEEPFSQRKDIINISALEYYCEKTGIPGLGDRQGEQGPLGVSYNSFGSPRYLMTMSTWAMNDVLENVPYDAVILLCNSDVYGGGGVYNFYATTYSGGKAPEVLIHEFGHSFAGLGDEYADNDSDVGLQNINAEPYERNVTTMIHFEDKWGDMIEASTPVPTPESEQYADKVGVFEGACYVSKGFYRPYLHCMMRDLKHFCPVCKKIINDMLDLYSE